jgi:glycosyltransferase involved in cell wall biosynthesis
MNMGQGKLEVSQVQISIIVPITQMHGRLGELTDWLTRIDFQLIEVILVHDKQDELTGIDLNQLNEIYPKIKIIEKHLMSAGLARNVGIEASIGNWIVFWDSDDIPHVTTLQTFVAKLKPNEIDAYIYNYQLNNQGFITSVNSHTIKDLAINPGIWRMIFSRKLIANITFPSFPLGEDQFFLAQLELPIRRVQFNDECLYTYKFGVPGQASSKGSNLPKLKKSIDALEILRRQQKGVSYEFSSILYWRQVMTLLKRGTLVMKGLSLTLILKNICKINTKYFANLSALSYVVAKILVKNE